MHSRLTYGGYDPRLTHGTGSDLVGDVYSIPIGQDSHDHQIQAVELGCHLPPRCHSLWAEEKK